MFIVFVFTDEADETSLDRSLDEMEKKRNGMNKEERKKILRKIVSITRKRES
jgi:hypothetical protein